MKKFSILILAVLFAGIAMGQEIKREKVKRITQADKSLEWYQAQKKLWKQEVDKNPKSEEAWWNYYEAHRGELHRSGGNPFGSKSSAMKIVDEMEKSIPNNFIFNHCKSNQMGKEKGFEEYMIKAYEMEPNNPLTYENLIVYYEMVGNLVKRKEVVNKMYQNGEVSVGLLNEGFNILQTIDEEGVVITGGDNDTYPLWVLQDVFKIRTDVIVANKSMIKDVNYRSIILNRIGINYSEKDKKDQKATPASKVTMEMEVTHTRNFIEFVAKKSNKKVYVSQSTWRNGGYGIPEKFYNVGMAWLYSEDDIDNIAITRKNFFKL